MSGATEPEALRTTPARAVCLRRAAHGDVDAIAGLEARAFSDPWSRASFATLVDNPSVFFVVADLGPSGSAAGPLGYLVAWFVADEGEIANVAVAPAARGTGIGGRLLDAALAEAARRGAQQLFLEVRESNAVARALYAARGFQEVGRRKRYYRHPVEDALVLRRPAPGAAAPPAG